MPALVLHLLSSVFPNFPRQHPDPAMMTLHLVGWSTWTWQCGVGGAVADLDQSVVLLMPHHHVA